MPIITKDNENLYLKKIDTVFFESYDEEPEQWSKYLNDKNSDQYAEIVQRMVGLGKWEEKAEMQNATEDRYRLGDLITTTHKPFGKQVVMSREQVKDQKYGEIEDMSRDSGHAARETVEAECVKVLDDAFTVNQYDGKPLCDDAHPYKNSSSTWDNKLTGGLTDANLRSGLVLFRKQKDEAQKQIMQRPSKLITHQANQFAAAVILQSAQVSGTANNDKNPLPTLEIVELDFLASETAWFLQGKRHRLQHYWREAVEWLREEKMRDNGSWVWNGYFRHSTAVEDSRGIIGSAG